MIFPTRAGLSHNKPSLDVWRAAINLPVQEIGIGMNVIKILIIKKQF